MNASNTLPLGFESLEPFVAQWGATTLAARDNCRLESTGAERKAFYSAAAPLLPQAFDYLEGKPLGKYDDRDQRLMNLALSLVHVSLAEEVQLDFEDFHAEGARAMRITRGHMDQVR